MSITTSTNYTETLDQIINDALGLIGVIGDSEIASPSNITLVQRSLNRMIKAWMAQGSHLFGYTEGVLFPVIGQNTYLLSNDATSANATNTAVVTTATTASAIGSAVLHVTSSTGMTVGDKIGVVVSDGTIFWTTISTISTLTITMASVLALAVPSGSQVTTYTTRLNRPLRIQSMRRFNTTSSVDTPMDKILSRQEYFDIPVKSTAGESIQFYYDPQINVGKIYLWPTPDSSTTIYKFTYDRILSDMDSLTDNLDFPVEWIDAIIYNLAVRIGPFFGKTQKSKELAPLAQNFLAEARSFDTEIASLRIEPDFIGA